MRVCVLSLTAILLAAVGVSAEKPDVKAKVDLRLRWEGFGTPSGALERDPSYDFSNLRLRLGVEAGWEHVSLFGVLQGAAAADFPENGAFAIGPVYTAANSGETRPSQIGLTQLYVDIHSSNANFSAGRQKWGDGMEVKTGVNYLDGVKKRRMAERLVGNWDWVNVGRRFDGVSGGTGLGALHLSGFAFRPLAGGVNYQDSFSRLDGLEVYGMTLTSKYDELLPGTEVRGYVIHYDDDRPGAITAAGGKLAITTFGATLLAGNDSGDLMAWSAFQAGDWGGAPQSSWAFIVEGGRRFSLGETTATLRGGLARASGDGQDNGQHETFFNLLPTNHKFYGSMDYSAFANLSDLYGELLLQRGAWNFRGAWHHFGLVETGDAWYGGSGAFDQTRLGYAARRPASGSFSSSHLGEELDLSVGYKLHPTLNLSGGWSHFWGGDAAREILLVDDRGSWGYVELAWRR